MALRILQYAATIPAGTPKTAPRTTTFPLDNWEVEAVELEVPPGASGLMGFYVANNGVQWVPQPAGTWLVWNDVLLRYPLEGQPNASGWQVVGYNTGVFPHTVTVRFHVVEVKHEPVPVVAPQINIVTTPIETEPIVL
jgi:hypothetical protein